MNYEDSVERDQEQGYWRSEKMLFMTQEMGICSQERRAWELEEVAKRREKRIWQKNMVIGLKEQSSQGKVLFQCVPQSLDSKCIPTNIDGGHGLR